MTRYLIRVELNGSPPPATYDALHAALAARQAWRTIVADDGILYHLPRATYCADSDSATYAVHADALAVVRRYWQDVELFVARYDEAVFTLRPVREALSA